MLYIVTAVHNRYDITKKFIARICSQTYQDLRLLLVDDGCTDNTVSMVKEAMPHAIILTGDGNLFWGGALHMAYHWLKNNAQDTDYVMFANDDTSFECDYLEKAIDHLVENPDLLITGCGMSVNTGKQLDGAVHWDYVRGGVNKSLQPTDEGNCASTRSLFFTVKSMKKIGGFHPILLPHYCSDYEWTMRGPKKGIWIRSFDDLVYYYDEGTTGDNDLDTLTFKKLFSKRSSRNPIYRLNFILLSTPLYILPLHLFFQIKRYISRIDAFRRIMGR